MSEKEIDVDAPFCLIEDREDSAQIFVAPRQIVTAFTLDEVAPALSRIAQAARDGFYAAGFIAYEAGYAFEPRLERFFRPQPGQPLLRFGLFDAPAPAEKILAQPSDAEILDLRPGWSAAKYAEKFAACQNYIKAGDVYQINLTFPLFGHYRGTPLDVFRLLRARQPVALGGVVALGGDAIVSLSPERFFDVRQKNIVTRPMKGTARRGKTAEEDRALARFLTEDEKNRAENLMIVDLLRNDLSRICAIGSVQVPELFAVESFPTLHQMSSTVRGKLLDDIDLQKILQKIFPCGSVTGAPKIRAMEIIAEQEDFSRGAYCGAVGVISPDGAMRFNVAIRTLSLDAEGGFCCPVGSAVVADSLAQQEYDECLLKGRFLTPLKISG